MTKDDLKRLAEAMSVARARSAGLQYRGHEYADPNDWESAKAEARKKWQDTEAAFLQALEAPAVTEDAKAAQVAIWKHINAYQEQIEYRNQLPAGTTQRWEATDAVAECSDAINTAIACALAAKQAEIQKNREALNLLTTATANLPIGDEEGDEMAVVRNVLVGIKAAIASAVAAEREACARVAENSRPIGLHIAAAIRSRPATNIVS